MLTNTMKNVEASAGRGVARLGLRGGDGGRRRQDPKTPDL